MFKFFDKIFGKRVPQRVFTPRAPRIKLNDLHRMTFKSDAVAQVMNVETISMTGVGLGLKIPSTQVPKKLTGVFTIDSQLFAVELEVVRTLELSLGARFAAPSREFLAGLQTYFETELSALKLNPVRRELLKSTEFGQPYWFQGDNNCDLSFIVNGLDVVTFEITVFGNHLEGGEDKPLRVSERVDQSHAESERGARLYKPAEILSPSRSVDHDVVKMAMRMLTAVPTLAVEHRDAILTVLNDSLN